MNNSKNYLLITLGHGSSAIFVDNSGVKQRITGYEQERLSRIKSDSQFPIDALHKIMLNVGLAKMKGCKTLISHWFNDNDDITVNKYIPKECMDELCEITSDIMFTSGKNFSHHDAHAYSAYAFYRYNSVKFNMKKQDNAPIHFIVADGFGNEEEVLSIYRVDNTDDDLHLISRTYGYYSSLGLMYQYATSFVGMKENQDEYKFLGYESHIRELYSDADIRKIDELALVQANMLLSKIGNKKRDNIFRFGNIIDFDELNDVKIYWYDLLSDFLQVMKIAADSRECYNSRVVVAYYVQSIIEKVLTSIVKKFNIRHLCVAGGCFFNVKLNNALLNAVDGQFCAMPLAGDQGAAIGMYDYVYGSEAPFKFENLSWGKRKLYGIEKLCAGNDYMHVIKVKNGDYTEAIKLISGIVANGNIVDLVHGNMEFGPRALCNTSTIFLPLQELVSVNNRMNCRNEVMPCAPICTPENAISLFDIKEIIRVVGSDYYMICTHEYRHNKGLTYGGVMHKLPTTDRYTGRPQVVAEDKLMRGVLNTVQEMTDIKCLVNTSFNVHGNPIVFETADIISNYNFQCEHLDDLEPKPHLVVVIDEED